MNMNKTVIRLTESDLRKIVKESVNKILKEHDLYALGRGSAHALERSADLAREMGQSGEFDDEKIAWYTYNDLEQIEHAYSITIHKSQGSEFDVVIIAVPKAYPALLTRNLLYTGLTRAKKLLIVIGAKQTVDFMIQNIDTKQRNTGLEHKLKWGNE